jgi:hypothetical protein
MQEEPARAALLHGKYLRRTSFASMVPFQNQKGCSP